MAILTIVRKWGVRLLKTAGFLLISFIVGRSLGNPEIYINHDVAAKICDFIYGDVNAETMYDIYFYIDIVTVFAIATVIYQLTMKLIITLRK